MPGAVRRLALDEARRIAIRAPLLDADRPRDLGAVVDRLTFLQLDLTAAVAPSADLVAWSRLGDGYQRTHTSATLPCQAVRNTVVKHDSGRPFAAWGKGVAPRSILPRSRVRGVVTVGLPS
jgi:uncharacterized protein YcaQ